MSKIQNTITAMKSASTTAMIELNGIKYEEVREENPEDWSCRDCDIFRARPPKSAGQYPLCDGTKIQLECHSWAKRGIKRTFKKVEDENLQ